MRADRIALVPSPRRSRALECAVYVAVVAFASWAWSSVGAQIVEGRRCVEQLEEFVATLESLMEHRPSDAGTAHDFAVVEQVWSDTVPVWGRDLVPVLAARADGGSRVRFVRRDGLDRDAAPYVEPDPVTPAPGPDR